MKAFLLVFIMIPGWVLSNEKIDSLQNVIDSDPPLPEKVEAMYNLAEVNYYHNKDQSKLLAEKIFNISSKANYKKGIWKSYNISGYLQYISSSYDSAIHYFSKAVAMDTRDEFIAEQIFSYYWLASSYIQKSEYTLAEDSFNKSLDLSIRNKNKKGIAKGYMGLGILHYQQSQYEKALYNYLKADSTYGDEVGMNHGDVLQNIAIVYHVLDQKVSEELYLNKALDIYNAIDDQYGISHVSIRLGNIAKEKKEYDKSLEHFQAAIPYFKDSKNNSKLAEIYSYMGAIHLKKENYQVALQYLNLASEIGEVEKLIEGNILLDKGLLLIKLNHLDQAYQSILEASTIADELKNLEFKQRVLKGLAEYYQLINDSEMVYQSLIQANKLMDSLASIKSSETLYELEAKYQNAKKQQEIELLAAQNDLKEQQKSKQLIIFLLITFALVVILAALAYRYKLKQQANKKLKEADQLKSSFLTNISHEFRTPLHLISGPVENSLKKQDLLPQQKQEMEMILRNSRQMLGLVDQLLELAKLESGSIKLRKDKIYLISTLKSLAASFEFVAEQKRIDYQLHFPEKELALLTFPDALQKIVMNLLGNAFKYTPDSGTVHFSTNVQSGRLFLEIRNTGEGIEPASLKQIFDRFYQTNSAADGLGIGLALVKELTELMEGKIIADSIPGEWTTFQLNFPVELLPEDIGPVENSTVTLLSEELTNQLPQENKYSLLIIDDNADTRQLMYSVLSSDYQLIMAENGQMGLDLARENVPDVIISDLMMPVLDGLELCKRIKTDELTSHIPVVLLTARAGDDNTLQGLEQGADDYLVKPFNQDLLKAKIKNLIYLRKKQQERYSREIILKPREVKATSLEEQFLNKVRQVLDNFLTDGDFNASKFSEEMSMSRMQLHRKLKALTGFSANELIMTHRLEMAARLLKSNHATVSEICYLVGFNDPSYFSKCFKEKFNVSPSDYSKVASIKSK